MVFFTCNACGESLKKAQVDKHVYACKGCKVFSCIDCGKDFWGDSYKTHNKCISEDQKYGGKGYEAKTKKGDAKQEQWMQGIHEAMKKPGVSSKLRQILSQIGSYDNVPRKKVKFQNWMKNSLKMYDTALQDEVWEIFSGANSNVDGAEQDGVTQEQNGGEMPTPEECKSKHKKQSRQDTGQRAEEKGQESFAERKKKRKRDEEECRDIRGENSDTVKESAKMRKKHKREEDRLLIAETEEDTEGDQSESSGKGKFNWKGTIKAVLKQSPEEGIAVKKLRKKVLAAYFSFSGEGNFRSEEELLSIFNKKVNNNPKFRVLKEKVTLVK